MTEGGLSQFDYIRPLATIEPTAIRLGLPVRTDFRYKDIAGLQGELTRQQYHKALIFVAWEHYELDRMVRNLVGAFVEIRPRFLSGRVRTMTALCPSDQ